MINIGLKTNTWTIIIKAHQIAKKKKNRLERKLSAHKCFNKEQLQTDTGRNAMNGSRSW